MPMVVALHFLLNAAAGQFSGGGGSLRYENRVRWRELSRNHFVPDVNGHPGQRAATP